MPAGVEFPPETKQHFLAALEKLGKVSGPGGACETIGVSVPIVYTWRHTDPEFAAAWTTALRMHIDTRAEKAWAVVDEILEDTTHKDRLAAAKVAIDRGDTMTVRTEGADDGIAEAIDRFTQAVIGLARPVATPDLQDTLTGRANLPARDALGPGES